MLVGMSLNENIEKPALVIPRIAPPHLVGIILIVTGVALLIVDHFFAEHAVTYQKISCRVDLDLLISLYLKDINADDILEGLQACVGINIYHSEH